MGLKPAEWEELAKLGDILKVFSDATLKVSASKTPTIPYVLPLFCGLEAHLQILRHDPKSSYNIRNAATKGLNKLLKYKSRAFENWNLILGTGESCSYSLIPPLTTPIVLHPAMRTKWFGKTVIITAAQAKAGKEGQDAHKKAQANEAPHVGVIVKEVATRYMEDAQKTETDATICSPSTWKYRLLVVCCPTTKSFKTSSSATSRLREELVTQPTLWDGGRYAILPGSR
jgi:hypothetical protein